MGTVVLGLVLVAGLAAQEPNAPPRESAPTTGASTGTTATVGTLRLSHAPGRYAAGLALEIASDEPRAVPFVSFFDSAGEPDGPERVLGAPRRVRGPLRLTALPGEERRHDLQVQVFLEGEEDDEEIDRQRLSYVVDRRAPPPPQLSPAPGFYQDGVQLSFELSGGSQGGASQGGGGDTDYQVWYAVDGSLAGSGRMWDGAPVLLSLPPGERREVVVRVAARDALGNQSRVVEASYLIDARRLAPAQLNVLSPVTGTFGNMQRLVVEANNVEWVRYSLDGRDPALHGQPYVEPTLLRLQGRINLQVAAMPRRAGATALRRAVEVNVAPEQLPSVVTTSDGGVVRDGFQVVLTSPIGAQLFYSLDDNTPDQFDVPYSRPLLVRGFPGSRKLVALRVRARLDEQMWGAEHRYLFDLDTRVPFPPRLIVSGADAGAGAGADGGDGATASQQVLAALESAAFATVFYTLDGSAPDQGARLYLEPFRAVRGTEVRAIAYSPSGTASAVTVARLGAARSTPPPPVVASPATGATVNRDVLITVAPPPDGEVRYELTTDGSVPPPPTVDSAPAPARLHAAVPDGDRRAFAFRFATVDGASVSPSSDLGFTIDRRAPACAAPSPVAGATTDGGDAAHVLAPAVTVGAASVHYTLTNDGSEPQDPTRRSPVLERLELAGVADAAVDYRLKVVCRDQFGNESDVIGPLAFLVDRRLPRIPILRGFTDGALYADSEVRLDFVQRDNLELRYTVAADGAEPPAPTPQSPVLTPQTVFAGTDDEVTRFRVSILPIGPRGEQGPVQTIGFTIDRAAPRAPLLSGFDDGATYTRPVTVSSVSPALGDDLYLAISRGAPQRAVVSRERRYSGPVTVDVAPGEEEVFFVVAVEVDAAGNQSQPSEASFTIDRRPPGVVAVRGLPSNGLSNRAVRAELIADAPSIFYELTEDGATPGVPGEGSALYVEPLTLTGAAGQDVLYQLRVRAMDTVGNLSPPQPIVAVRVDRRPPDPPPPAVVERNDARGSSTSTVSWPVAARDGLQVAAAAPGQDAPFVPYRQPLRVSAADDAPTVVRARRVDAAGNVSAVVTTVVGGRDAASTPQIRGVEDGRVYREQVAVTLFAPAPAVAAASAAGATARGSPVLRYEVGTDAGPVRPVDADSPIATGRLPFDAMLGETVRYELRVRSMDGRGQPLSAERTVRFTVDRTPPAPPVLIGAEHGGFYADTVSITLLSAEGEVRYAVVSGATDAELDAELPPLERFSPAPQTIRLAKVGGKIVSYLVAAYVEDEVGNRSTASIAWRISVDDRAVYVRADGNDQFAGTRTRPFRTLARGIAEAQRIGRREVWVAEGEYRLDRTLRISGDLAILGGFDGASWAGPGVERASTLLPGRFLQPGAALLEIAGGQLRLEDFRLTDPRGPGQIALLRAAGGDAVIEDCELLVVGDGSVAIDVRGGFLTLRDSTLSVAPSSTGVRGLLRHEGGSLFLSRSQFRGPLRGDAFTAIEVVDSDDTTLDRVRVDPGGARRTVGLRVSGSQVSVTGGSLSTGRGSLSAAALSAVGSTVALDGAELAGDGEAAYGVVIEAADTALSVTGGELISAARLGSTAVRARGGSVRLDAALVTATPTLEYSYLIDLDATSGRVQNSILQGADSGEVVLVNLAGSPTTWVNNTIVGATGTNVTVGFRVRGGGRGLPRLVNNQLVRPQGQLGTAVAVAGTYRPFPLVANNVAGWQYTLRAADRQAREPRTVTPGPAARAGDELSAADELNLLDGDPFGGPIDENESEDVLGTFGATFGRERQASPDQQFMLVRTARSVNAGVRFAAGVAAPATDFRGRTRPAPRVGITPGYDIGALELY